MPPQKKRMSEAEERIALLDSAERLGYEVGLKGHLDNVGEIGAKKRDLLRGARDIGVLEKMMFKYAAAKEAGTKERRLSIYSKPKPKVQELPTKPAKRRTAAPERPAIEPGPRGLHFEDEIRFTSDIPPERLAINPRALVNLVEAAEAESMAKYQRFYDVLMNIADVSDEVPYIRGRETLENVLEALQKNGWIDNYVIEMFNDITHEVYIILESAYAKFHGKSPKPICKIIMRTIEQATSSAFGREVRVVETKCMAQGYERCEFSSF